jgi:hypothetical protein
MYSTHITKTPTHYKTHTNTLAYLLHGAGSFLRSSQTHTLQNPHIHARTHAHTHTLQNNIKPPQYKLKQNAHRKIKVSSEVFSKEACRFMRMFIVPLRHTLSQKSEVEKYV